MYLYNWCEWEIQQFIRGRLSEIDVGGDLQSVRERERVGIERKSPIERVSEINLCSSH